MRRRFVNYARRYLITSWFVVWILAASIAPALYEAHPQSLRLFIALGFIAGSVLGETLFVPLVVRERMLAFAAVIAAGILANLLMGVGFLILSLTPAVVNPSWQATGFYVLMLPSSIIWFSGGAYLAVSRLFPEMRDVKLSARPWRGP